MFKTAVSFNDVKAKMGEMLMPSLMVSFAYLAQALIVATDVLIISWLGVEELASAGFVVRIYMPFFLLALGFSLPILAMCGRALGQGDNKQLRSVFQHSGILTLFVSIASVYITKYLLIEYLNYINQPANIIAIASEYADIFLWSIPLVVWGSSIRSVMTVIGYVKPFMILGFCIFILNAVLDYILVFGITGVIEPMGISGAAIATIIVNLSYLILLALILIKKSEFKGFEILTKFEKINFGLFKDISLMGIPMSIRMIVETGLMTYYYSLMAGFGLLYLGAYQVAYQFDTIAFLFAIGTSTAISTRVGIANGKNNIKEMLSISYAGILLMTIKLTIIGLLVMIFAGAITNIFFGGGENYELIKPIAINMLIIVAIYQIVHSLYFAILSAIDGMGKTRASSIIFMFCLVFFGAGGAYVLSQSSLGGYGILIACFGSYVMSFFLLLPLFVKHIKKYENE